MNTPSTPSTPSTTCAHHGCMNRATFRVIVIARSTKTESGTRAIVDQRRCAEHAEVAKRMIELRHVMQVVTVPLG